jgi:hypothetical protein
MELRIVYYYLGLLFMFTIGLCIIIFSSRFVAWIWGWSVPLLDKFNKSLNIPEGKSAIPNWQRTFSIWALRVFGSIVCGGALAMLITYFVQR